MSALTILIIGHAEKPDDPEAPWQRVGFTEEGTGDKKSLVIRGWQRAVGPVRRRTWRRQVSPAYSDLCCQTRCRPAAISRADVRGKRFLRWRRGSA
jgi:hypothetical protein